jgi:hypothetical protein
MDGGMVLSADGLSKYDRMVNGSPLQVHQERLLRAIFLLTLIFSVFLSQSIVTQ